MNEIKLNGIQAKKIIYSFPVIKMEEYKTDNI